MTSIGDLVTLAIFLCITPQVREAAAALARGEKKGWSIHNRVDIYQYMYHTLTCVHCDKFVLYRIA